MRVLITGATGFIGQILMPYVLAQPETAVSLLLRETHSGRPVPPSLASHREQLQFVYADLRNYQLTARAVAEAEPDVVIHLAAAGVTDPFMSIDTALRHNLNGTIHLARACFEKRFGTRRLVVARTPGEHSSMNVYAASKAAAWQFCHMFARTQGWPIVGSMVFHAYGPGQTERNLIPAALQAARSGHDFPMTAGTQRRDWIYVEDVMAGLWQTAVSPHLPSATTIELGTGQATSVADVVRLIYTLFGTGGQPLIGRLPGRPGEEPTQVADVAQTEALIGWKTAVSLPDGLRKIVISNR